MTVLKSLRVVLPVIGMPVVAMPEPSPAMRQLECEHVDPASLIPQAEQSFRQSFRGQVAKGEIFPNAKLNFARDEFSFNQGIWLLPFTVASPKGQRTYFALVNCISGVEFSAGISSVVRSPEFYDLGIRPRAVPVDTIR